MTHLELDPKLAEAFQSCMLNAGWNLVNKEAGQVHILGWGYTIQWQKDANTVSLHYKELQTKIDARLELSTNALPEIKTILECCYD